MPTLAAVLCDDGETPLVQHTFTPLGPDADGVQWFEETVPAPANSLAAKRFSVSIKRPAPGKSLDGVARVTIRLWLPVMETLATSDTGITPAPTVAYRLYAELRYVVPERSTVQERKNMVALVKNFTSAASILDVIQKLQPLY